MTNGPCNRAGERPSPLLAPRHLRRLDSSFLCTGLCSRAGERPSPLLAPRPVRRPGGSFLCTGLCIKNCRQVKTCRQFFIFSQAQAPLGLPPGGSGCPLPVGIHINLSPALDNLHHFLRRFLAAEIGFHLLIDDIPDIIVIIRAFVDGKDKRYGLV